MFGGAWGFWSTRLLRWPLQLITREFLQHFTPDLGNEHQDRHATVRCTCFASPTDPGGECNLSTGNNENFLDFKRYHLRLLFSFISLIISSGSQWAAGGRILDWWSWCRFVCRVARWSLLDSTGVFIPSTYLVTLIGSRRILYVHCLFRALRMIWDRAPKSPAVDAICTCLFASLHYLMQSVPGWGLSL